MSEQPLLPGIEHAIKLDRSVWDGFRPRPKVRSFDWICEHARMPDGRPFDPGMFPWAEGIIDAFDDPHTRFIVMQFASRLGKTATVHCILLMLACINPVPMMFASSTMELVKTSMRDKLSEMVDKCLPLRKKRLPRTSLYRIDLRDARLYAAWSGSVTMLSDKSIHTLHINECDKWDDSVNLEANSIDLAIERTKEFPTRKIFIESTPTITHRSRVERELMNSTNSRFHVPCPWCGCYQQLIFGNEGPEEVGGLTWDKDEKGHFDADLAYRTARYLCKSCKGAIKDEHRTKMIRAGVWVPDGCRAEDGKVLGDPKRSPVSQGFQLSSLYSMQLVWGDIASQWVKSWRVPRERQNFVNSWLGETFSLNAKAQTWEDLGERLCVEGHEYGVVPPEVGFLTVGIDRQIDHWVYWVHGWAKWRTSWLIAYGVEDDWDVLVREVIRRQYGKLTPVLTLVDSGYETDDTYRKCKEASKPRSYVYPSKGVKSLPSGAPYERRILDLTGRKTLEKSALFKHRGLAGQWIVFISTGYYQELVQGVLDGLSPGDQGSLTIPREAKDDEDMLQQLLNETLSSELDNKMYERREWIRIDEAIPNDFRDAWRYAACGADIYTRNAWGRVLPHGRAIVPEPTKGRAGRKEARKFIRRQERAKDKNGKKAGFIRRT